MGRGSRSLPDLTGRLTARADDGHAPLLSVSGKVFSLTFTTGRDGISRHDFLLSPLVRFLALSRIKPQPPPLVCSPANSLKYAVEEVPYNEQSNPLYSMRLLSAIPFQGIQSGQS